MNGIKAAVLAVIAAVILKLFVFDFITAYGHSMEPSINDGTILIISRLRYGLRLPGQMKYLIRWDQPKAGEVLVFYTPEGDLAVKRVVTAVTSAADLINAVDAAGAADTANVAVAETYFYAEGDNSLTSYDSRSYGPVPADNIIGKVLGY
ncbi:MAG: signal peptidase I [Treponema sp.]|nr:signal peptidase I [Treponema sp.]